MAFGKPLKWPRSVLYLICACFFPAAAASGDTVWLQSGRGNAVALQDVKITGVQGDQITYTTASGTQMTKSLKQVPELKVDDEPALSAAEEAFAKRDWASATENYHKAQQTSTKDWVKARSTLRLLESADRSGNFAAAVSGFIELLQTNPGAANDLKPGIPKGNAQSLDPAIAQMKQASVDPKLNAEQKTVLLNYLVDLYSAKGDNTSAAAVSQQLGKVAPAEANTPANRKIQADARLTQARQEMGQKQYAKAIQTLDSGAGVLTEPPRQADALFLIAQCKEASARADDPDQLKDVAIAYLRIVANFKSAEGKPHVAESLLRAASIEEKLKNTKEALALYHQVSAEFRGTGAATQAEQDAERLAAANKG